MVPFLKMLKTYKVRSGVLELFKCPDRIFENVNLSYIKIKVPLHYALFPILIIAFRVLKNPKACISLLKVCGSLIKALATLIELLMV